MSKYVTYHLNCWETLKTIELKHRDEIYSSVNVVKTEKIYLYGARLNPKHFIMGNQQASPEKGKLQRLFRKEVGPSGSKWVTPIKVKI